MTYAICSTRPQSFRLASHGGEMQKTRIGYLDIAKGIAIIFIVVGHNGLLYNETIPGGEPLRLVHFAFTFHLPVFFIASGYFFKASQELSGSYFKKSARSLLLPYLITCILIIAGSMLMGLVLGVSPVTELFRWLGASLYGEGAQNPNSFFVVERIGGIWFLLALFWAQIVVIAANKTKHPWLWIASLFVIGWASAQYIWLPWSIQSGLLAAVFLNIGRQLREKDIFGKYLTSKPLIGITLLVWLVYIFGTTKDMSFAQFILPSGVFDIFGSLCAAFFVFSASRGIELHAAHVSRFLQWIGRNTLVIFCIHILEDNIMMPVWIALEPVLGGLFGAGGWVALLAIRFCLIAAISAAIYAIPGICNVYFPKKETTLKSPAMTDLTASPLSEKEGNA